MLDVTSVRHRGAARLTRRQCDDWIYRLVDDDALATTLIEGAAILTSTSSIGFFVQARVT
jgi:hypothetical protein